MVLPWSLSAATAPLRQEASSAYQHPEAFVGGGARRMVVELGCAQEAGLSSLFSPSPPSSLRTGTHPNKHDTHLHTHIYRHKGAGSC